MKAETARTAAKWWAGQLRGCASKNAGMSGTHGATMRFLAIVTQELERETRDEDDEQRFEDTLFNLLLPLESATLSCDYHPQGLLRQAAQEASIDIADSMPWKTSMQIVGGQIRLKEGHGAPYTRLPIKP